MRKVLLFVITIFLFWGCVKKGAIENLDNPKESVKLELISKIELQDMPSDNPMFGIGEYNGKRYILHRKGKKFLLKFYDSEFREISKIVFSRGKGPGEFMHQMGVKIVNEKIYVYDITLRKFLIYDMKGNFIDEFFLTKNDMPISFLPYKNKIYFSSIMKYLFAIYDMDKSKIIAFKEYKTAFSPKKQFRGILFIKKEKDGVLGMKMVEKNLRISLFDDDGNEIKKFVDLKGDYISINALAYNGFLFFNEPTKIKKTVGSNKKPNAHLKTAVINMKNYEHRYNLVFNEKDVRYWFITPVFITDEVLCYYNITDKGHFLYIFKNPFKKNKNG